MGDFQDVFGAGADVEAVIDGIVAQELRAAREEAAARAPEPVRLWFATLYEAERWAEARPEVNYLRRPHLGGYEMIVPGEQFSRSPEAFYNTGAEVALARLPEELRAEGGRMRGDLRLAEGADNHAGALLRDLCAQLPLGRARQFPLRLTLGELCVTMNGWNDRAEAEDARSPAFCHLVDPRQGTVTILAKDHTALVALVTAEGELRLEPWVFEAGPRGVEAEACHGDHDEAAYEGACAICRVFHGASEARASEARVPERLALHLAAESRYWAETLEPYTRKLGAECLPAALVRLEFTQDTATRARIRGDSIVAAHAMCAKQGFSEGYRVTPCVVPRGAGQFAPPQMRLRAGSYWCFETSDAAAPKRKGAFSIAIRKPAEAGHGAESEADWSEGAVFTPELLQAAVSVRAAPCPGRQSLIEARDLAAVCDPARLGPQGRARAEAAMARLQTVYVHPKLGKGLPNLLDR
ncbi:hypothetical protein [Roseovarius nubinhibens]|uniref:Uncharacterized protein n=1 Tax=Roseovarius nubinhibens TaxID=314263 RepID=A0A348WCF0_9RHOB|nr:hypothetical protein [Roseovarius nubinhibens]